MGDQKSFIRGQIQFAHNVLEQVIADCDVPSLNDKAPGATINSIGAVYAHVVIAEDFIINGMIGGKTPIFIEQGWADRTGVPTPAGPSMNDEWAAKVDMKLAAFREYAKVVHDNTVAVIDGMSEADAARTIQAPMFGNPSALEMIGGLGVTHVWNHLGEIAAMKGMRGMKGLPF